MPLYLHDFCSTSCIKEDPSITGTGQPTSLEALPVQSMHIVGWALLYPGLAGPSKFLRVWALVPFAGLCGSIRASIIAGSNR